MTRPKIILSVTLIALIIFAASAYLWTQQQADVVSTKAYEDSLLERPHSPSFGPKNAKVTIVEFFDPACEACRAFYPFVKRIMAENPDDVRVVLRYTTFHKGSDEVVRILEAARLQNLFKPVLEAILIKQPLWADHGNPNLSLAWDAVKEAGLDIEQAREDMQSAAITNVLQQDNADVKAVGVEKTPTFFVNGRPLQTFGAKQLVELVNSELAAQ
ncbi:DsbA family protein [Amphritea sp. HPY]|uniref:DsbA family protein n=1 Tax=Amphritea sp. HPY TaxID=3421652 RepID=UPI003D7D0260